VILDVGADGGRHALDVRRDGERWLVTLDGRQIAASVAEVGGRWSLLIGPPEAGLHTRSYEVSIEPGPGGDLLVHVDGHGVRVTMPDFGGAGRRRLKAPAAGPAGPAAVVAPMPGRIVKVLVRPGDVVEPRQGLVVMEAMKMENELRAPQPGTVTDVRVREGMSVDAHAVLVVIG
jgi:hypothetical protein